MAAWQDMVSVALNGHFPVAGISSWIQQQQGKSLLVGEAPVANRLSWVCWETASAHAFWLAHKEGQETELCGAGLGLGSPFWLATKPVKSLLGASCGFLESEVK